MENHIKMDDLGAPLFLETPIYYFTRKAKISPLKNVAWKTRSFSYKIRLLTERQRMMKGCTITETKRLGRLDRLWGWHRAPCWLSKVVLFCNELNKRTKGDKY